MCLAVPAKVTEIKGEIAKVDVGGIVREISILMVPGVQVGDYVLVHTGFAIEKIDREEAKKTLALFEELMADEVH